MMFAHNFPGGRGTQGIFPYGFYDLTDFKAFVIIKLISLYFRVKTAFSYCVVLGSLVIDFIFTSGNFIEKSNCVLSKYSVY